MSSTACASKPELGLKEGKQKGKKQSWEMKQHHPPHPSTAHKTVGYNLPQQGLSLGKTQLLFPIPTQVPWFTCQKKVVTV